MLWWDILSLSKLDMFYKHLLFFMYYLTDLRYLAAKTYYFGVGGGIREFEQFIDKKKVFKSIIKKEFTEGNYILLQVLFLDNY